MKKYCLRNIIILVFGVLTLSNVNVGGKKGRLFVQRSRFEYSSVLLMNNGRFNQFKRSCTYSFETKGHWYKNGDTINLVQEKVKIKFGDPIYTERAKQLLAVGEDTLYYTFYSELLGNIPAWALVLKD